MKSTLYKDTYREIKKSLGRFLSILFIIAIGVAFYAGVKVSSPTMEYTANKYFNDTNLYDIEIISNLGFDKDDISEIGKVKGVSQVSGRKSKDFLTYYKGTDLSIRVHGEDFSKINNKDYINKPIIVEGRIPKSKNECLIEESKSLNVKVGDIITLKTPNSEKIQDSLLNEEYVVVGKVMMPSYISHQKGSTTVGSGTLNTYMLIGEENFKSDIFTQCYVRVYNPNNYSSYTDEYKKLIKEVNSKLENLATNRASLRYNKIISEANTKITDGYKNLQEKKDKVNKSLSEANDKLINGEKEILNGEKEISEKEKSLENLKISGNISLDKNLRIIEEKEANLSKQYKDFLVNKQKTESEIKLDREKVTTLTNQKTLINNKIIYLEERLLDENLTDVDKNRIIQEINTNKKNLDNIENNISEINAVIEYRSILIASSEEEFIKGFETISIGKENIKSERKRLNNAINEYKNKINEGKESLEVNREKLASGRNEYNFSKEKAESEFLKAEVDLKNARLKINDVKSGKWYVLDRQANYGIVEYGNSSTSIESIAKVFPIFFFLVAALICVTTMTRMIDEQRTTIGTLKALGYSNLSIMMKYILYSLLASVFGSILGFIVGISIFPYVIFNTYATMTFTLPKMSLNVSITTVIEGFIIAIGTTLIATIISCYKDLLETPSTLMRPKPPKSGKRIVLEKIGFIWSRLSFIQKVTVRNLFRYKKRFFMTIIGIAGCSALVLSGFGIRDSIGSIVDKQYKEVFNYDGVINYKKEVTISDINTSLNNTLEKNLITNSQNVRVKKMLFSNVNGIKKEGNIFVPEKSNELHRFINLIDRSGKTYKISNDGVIITEKLAKLLSIKFGDDFYIEDDNKVRHKLKVEGIVENYIDHYVYMNKELFNKTFNQEVKFNQKIFECNNLDKNKQLTLTSELIKNDNVSTVSYNLTIKDTFDSMISNLKYIVLLMIISAGALAFVVLYNLTNVNISERIREIATIKVLGFYDREVSSYVFRENIILTIIGGAVGLVLGVALHRFIMVTAELDLIMFGRNINMLSYIYSFMITIGFSFVVNCFMYFKLKTIKMVESLKSVE